MHLLKCENGHIYDTDKFRTCPHCSSIQLDLVTLDTVGQNQTDIETEIPESTLQENYERISRRKVVGLLICVEGEMLGEGFILREGENDIGRASNMDIPLTREVTISRKDHATIRYDKDNYTFTLQAGEGKTDVYCNGKQITEPYSLGDRELIQIGDCQLIFIEAGSIW